ncbi:MAG: nitroreductase family deazaflavin-dependent oxidoreductase [Rhodococcus sp. (in: high G+C Gram-positive bacteria)]
MQKPDEPKISPADQAREHIATVAETGTTESIDFLGRRVVLLTTRGVRSAEPRTVPLMRIAHDGVYAVIASRAGAPTDPAWCANAKAEPRVQLQDGAVIRDFTARKVTGEEKATWWARAVAIFPFYEKIQATTDRDIPVFVLTERLT